MSKVLVLNRGDCCGDDLNGFSVRVDDVASLQSAGVCPLRVRGSSKLHERSRERREVEASLSKYRFVARVGAGVEVDGSIGMDGGPSR